MATVIKMFGFLNKYPKKEISVDSTDLNQVKEYEILKPCVGNQHCGFEEEIDPSSPEPLMK